MEPKDWLTLAIGERSVEPVQVQKIMFLFAKKADAPEDETYDFVPYNWGPCSFQIYDDLENLIDQEVVEPRPTARGWSRYGLTEHGLAVLEDLRNEANLAVLDRLDEVRSWVTSRSFRELLTEIYKDYPDYAVESRFTD